MYQRCWLATIELSHPPTYRPPYQCGKMKLKFYWLETPGAPTVPACQRANVCTDNDDDDCLLACILSDKDNELALSWRMGTGKEATLAWLFLGLACFDAVLSLIPVPLLSV